MQLRRGLRRARLAGGAEGCYPGQPDRPEGRNPDLFGEVQVSRRFLGPVFALTAMAALVAATAALADPAGQAGPRRASTSCSAPTSVGAARGWKIADPRCSYDYQTNSYTGVFRPLVAAAGSATSTIYSGVDQQAAYRIEVPLHWNGDLVLYEHPYRGLGHVVWVTSPALRSWFVSHGYAWAASSFARNGYNVGQAVIDTQHLLGVFSSRTRQRARAVYLVGKSMGGQAAAVEAEDFKGRFAGVMAYCAPLAGTQLYDYYLGVNVTAAALAGTPISFPAHPSLGSVLQYEADVSGLTLPKLGSGFLTPAGPSLTGAGKRWETAVEYLSGGPRRGFAAAFSHWNSVSYGPLSGMPTLFDLYPGLVGGTIGVASGNVTSNVGVVYRDEVAPTLTAADKALNAKVLRVRATVSTPPGSLSAIPPVVGDPGIPVMALYGTGDLFVPLSMGQDYAAAMAAHGESKLFVARAIREVGHCDYSTAELSQAFSALVSWVRTGRRAAGDDITNPTVVASAGFGCRFTDGSHPLYKGPPCPAPAKA